MDLDLIPDPATPPDEVVAGCREAERLGVRAVCAWNYHQDRDPSCPSLDRRWRPGRCC